MAIQLLVTDRNLDFLGDPIVGWSKLSCDLNYRAPASGSVVLPARPEVMELLQPGNRMVLMRDGGIWCAGPLEAPQDPYVWDLEENAGVGTVTARWTDDLGRIAGYLTYPHPGVHFPFQVTERDQMWTRTANSEAVIRELVSLTCGPTALAERRIERLVLDAVAGVGTTRTLSTRLEPLLDACRTLAVPDGLGFRTRQVGDEIRFGVYQPTDRTATARFSAGLGNLRRVEFTLSAPLATSELVMGGEDPAQQVPAGDPPNHREYTEVMSGAQADWYRVEKLVQSRGKTNFDGELTQDGVLALGNDNPQASLATVAVDTEDLRAGRDYGLGDLVSVVLPTGLEIADVVQSIGLIAEPNSGELVTTVIGNSDKTTLTRMVWTVRDLAYRLGQLEGRG
ncbi:Gp37-like protein [Streptomyces sp. NRRL F-5650]|uniref:Gp37-like protein n=1 Tax=Streptomyces sp. NRRL F-5650 TaxID=1463868 RepID=UPI0004C962C3|nr:siphovirus ReqiPepy6 Gp37-like family protein [Streptomyces sp. NRRL F-5650]